jgi:hypothetical protein
MLSKPVVEHNDDIIVQGMETEHAPNIPSGATVNVS